MSLASLLSTLPNQWDQAFLSSPLPVLGLAPSTHTTMWPRIKFRLASSASQPRFSLFLGWLLLHHARRLPAQLASSGSPFLSVPLHLPWASAHFYAAPNPNINCLFPESHSWIRVGPYPWLQLPTFMLRNPIWSSHRTHLLAPGPAIHLYPPRRDIYTWGLESNLTPPVFGNYNQPARPYGVPAACMVYSWVHSRGHDRQVPALGGSQNRQVGHGVTDCLAMVRMKETKQERGGVGYTGAECSENRCKGLVRGQVAGCRQHQQWAVSGSVG